MQVDMPFSVRTMTAKLATKTPLVRPGPDLCVAYDQSCGYDQKSRSVPEGRPAQYPARKASLNTLGDINRADVCICFL